MLNSLGLGFVFSGRDLLSGTMRKMGANFDDFTGRAEKNSKRMRAATALGGASIGALTLGIGSLGGAFATAKVAGEFEQSIDRVGALSQATSDELDLLRRAAIDAGMITQFSPKEAADGLADFAAQGFNARDSARALTPALDFAAGGMISVEQAAATMAAAVKVFGGGVDSAGLKADQMLRISNSTALAANDLEIAIGNVARGAIPAKQRIEEMLPAIGLIKNAGVDASVASTAVASALDFMAQHADKFKTNFGVSISDAEGNIRPFLDIVNEVNEAGRGMGTTEFLQKLTESAGRFGKTAFATIGKQLDTGIKDARGKVLKGAEAIAFLRLEMENAGGAAKEFRDRLLDNLPGQMVILKGALQTLAVTLGEPLAKGLKPIVTAFAALMTRVIRFIEDIPAPAKEALGKVILIFGVLATAAGIGLGVSALGVLFAGAFKAIAVAATIATTALGGLLAIAGIVKLAFVGYSMAMDGATERTNVLTRAWEKTKLAFTALYALITGKPLSKEIVDDLQAAENRGVFEFVQSVGRLIIRFETMIDGITAGFQGIMEESKPVFDELMTAFSELGKSMGFVGDTFNNVAGSSKDSWFDAGVKIGSVIAHIVLFFVRATTVIIQSITWLIENFDRIWATIKLGLILFATFRASIIAFRVGVIALNAAVVALTAIKTAWLWLMNPLNIAMLRLNAALIISQVRARAVALAVGLLNGVKALWAAITSGQIIKLTILNARLLAFRLYTLAAAAAQSLLAGAGGIKGVLGGLLGKAGLIGAAAAAGYAFGSWLDETLKLSDGIADLLADVTGLNDELAELDERNGGRTNQRGSSHLLSESAKAEIAAQSSVEAARLGGSQAAATSNANQQSLAQFLDERPHLSSKDLAQELAKMPPPVIEIDGQRLGELSAMGLSSADAREFRQVSVE